MFSPQGCSLDVLAATLTPDRRRLAEDLIDQLEAALESGSQRHNLVVGPRGSGKTHVLSYVRKEMVRRHPGDAGPRVLALSEEERSIGSFFDLILACLRSTGRPAMETMACLRRVPRQNAEAEALRMLQEEIRSRCSVLVLENLSAVLAGLQRQDVHRLRAFLQESSPLSLLASSCELFSGSQQPDHPFHGFFNLHYLDVLPAHETAPFLSCLAGQRGQPDLASALIEDTSRARISAIHHLTGGSHRLLAILSGFLTVDGLQELVAPFVQMMDRELTPYYQQRLDRLSPQQNKILDAITDFGGRAVFVSKLTDHTFLSPQVLTRQLYDLHQAGLVRRVSMGRESCYELSEPLMRWVLDMKAGREDAFGWIVRILRVWYENDELDELTGRVPEDLVARALVEKGALLGREGTSADAVKALLRGLSMLPAGHPLRKHAASELFGQLSRDLSILPGIRDVLRVDLVAGGLLQWIHDSLPLSPEDAGRLGRVEEALGEEFADVPEFLRVLDVLGAVRRDAEGDGRALLEIPLEIRSLILQRLGRKADGRQESGRKRREKGPGNRLGRGRKRQGDGYPSR